MTSPANKAPSLPNLLSRWPHIYTTWVQIPAGLPRKGFHLLPGLITSGGRSANLAYLMHNISHKTDISTSTSSVNVFWLNIFVYIQL